MTAIDRRTFLKSGLTVAGGLALAGPFQGMLARAAMAQGGLPPVRKGFGPLVPIPDKRDGEIRLLLPKGFNYRSFSYTGESMDDGYTVPGRQDGMAAFRAGRGRIRLVRNHEVNGPGPAIGDADKAYDPMAQGGTTTLEISPHAENVRSWVSMNGTQLNCAGGAMPWGSWITAEETVNGPDVGNDFSGGDNSKLKQQHGYIFEVESSWGPGQHEMGEPIRMAGRFPHEAVDWAGDHLYLTEDNFNFPSGFYRYLPPVDPFVAGKLMDGGTLEMLAIDGEWNAELHHGRSVGETLPVTWVTIDQPDNTFPEGTSNDEASQFVSRQGLAKGAAIFSRLEGIYAVGHVVYIVSTQGGDAPGSPPGGGFGDGFGQVWRFDIPEQTLTLVYESPGKEVLDLPDNLAVSPRGGILLCEDGTVDNFLRVVTEHGDLWDFSKNAIQGREGEEFAGATFRPNGNVLYVNIQASSGLTLAIWGPFAQGGL
ncbi:MAG: alkaline phosphatase PhoX [Actinomycetota bacterium]